MVLHRHVKHCQYPMLIVLTRCEGQVLDQGIALLKLASHFAFLRAVPFTTVEGNEFESLNHWENICVKTIGYGQDLL